jgi:hypothetical protein
VSDRDLVDCKLCGALLDRTRRPQHIGWHAAIQARIHGLTSSINEINARPEEGTTDGG